MMPVTKGQCAKMHVRKNYNVADKYTVSGTLEQLDNFDFDMTMDVFRGKGVHCYLPGPGLNGFEDGDRGKEDSGP